jgi:DNA-binding GntR family transcriptional regulator
VPASRSTPRPAATPTAAASGTLDQAVYDGLFDAVMQGRLPPGARLGEAALCAQFGVSRTVVRQALRRLAESQIVEIVPNKGATVAAPTPEETREVFEARRAVEAAIVRRLAQHIGASDIARLHTRLQAEHAALHQGDHARWVALAGGFHLALAQLAGNRVLQRLLTELMTRCSLIVALYEAPGDSSCEHDEHVRLVDLLALRDGDAAAALMSEHLLALEARLRVPPASTPLG